MTGPIPSDPTLARALGMRQQADMAEADHKAAMEQHKDQALRMQAMAFAVQAAPNVEHNGIGALAREIYGFLKEAGDGTAGSNTD